MSVWWITETQDAPSLQNVEVGRYTEEEKEIHQIYIHKLTMTQG